MNLSGKHVAMLVENNYQEMEVWYPIYRLREAGARVTTIGPAPGRYLSKLGYPVVADLDAAQAQGQAFDAVIVPGGYAPDLMRANAAMVAIVKTAVTSGRLVAAICHGSWMLVSADVIKGRRVTGSPHIKDDLRNAGCIYEDKEVVCDGNIVTSRKPDDLPAFCAAIVSSLAAQHIERAA